MHTVSQLLVYNFETHKQKCCLLNYLSQTLDLPLMQITSSPNQPATLKNTITTKVMLNPTAHKTHVCT